MARQYSQGMTDKAKDRLDGYRDGLAILRGEIEPAEAYGPRGRKQATKAYEAGTKDALKEYKKGRSA